MRTLRQVILVAVAATVIVGCAGQPATGDVREAEPTIAAVGDSDPTAGIDATASFVERMDGIDDAVAAWRTATSIEAARAAAETAANLVVGPNGPGYGDRNGDGIVGGETTAGVLPGLDGTPAGLAASLAGNACVARDVLGGPWIDPAAEWAAMRSAIDAWRANNNTMPSLGSHPMRIVGWATFTLRSDSLAEAIEYGGHAKLHVDVAARALDC